MVRGVLGRRARPLDHARPRKRVLHRLEIFGAEGMVSLRDQGSSRETGAPAGPGRRFICWKPLAHSALMPRHGRTIFHYISPRWPVGSASSSGAPIRTNTRGKPLIPTIWYSIWRYAYGTNGNWCIKVAAKHWRLTATSKPLQPKCKNPEAHCSGAPSTTEPPTAILSAPPGNSCYSRRR